MTTKVQTIDYTTWRNGKIAKRFLDGSTYRIGICPKCGRKGMIRPSGVNRQGQYCPMLISHKMEGLDPRWSIIVDWCEWDDRAAQSGEDGGDER